MGRSLKHEGPRVAARCARRVRKSLLFI